MQIDQTTRQIVMLDAATGVTVGNFFNTKHEENWSICIQATGVTSGGTINIEAYTGPDHGHLIHQETITASGGTWVYLPGRYYQLRTTVVSSDGTYSVSAVATTPGIQ